jgi:hypothetical protein
MFHADIKTTKEGDKYTVESVFDEKVKTLAKDYDLENP